MAMKLKIYYKLDNHDFDIQINRPDGDWVDIRVTKDIHLNGPKAGKLNGSSSRNVEFDSKLINLEIAMQLPKGCEAWGLPRSSDFKNYNIMLTNSKAIIDQTYCGDTDYWKFNVIAFADCDIPAGSRIAQFRIMPSMFATPWQKIKWLLSNGVEFIRVDKLDNDDRGGIGKTGKI